MYKNKLDRAVKYSVIIGVSLFVFLAIFIPSYFFIYLPKIHSLNEKRVRRCIGEVADRKINFLENRIAEEGGGIKKYSKEESEEMVARLNGLVESEEKDCYKKYPTKFQLP